MSDVVPEANQVSLPLQLLGLVVCLLICFAAAGIRAVATTPEIAGWYASLAKPSWNPPAWLFGPVWTTLYAMMAVAVWLVWRRPPVCRTQTALLLFGAQLVLNIAWSWIF